MFLTEKQQFIGVRKCFALLIQYQKLCISLLLSLQNIHSLALIQTVLLFGLLKTGWIEFFGLRVLFIFLQTNFVLNYALVRVFFISSDMYWQHELKLKTFHHGSFIL